MTLRIDGVKLVGWWMVNDEKEWGIEWEVVQHVRHQDGSADLAFCIAALVFNLDWQFPQTWQGGADLWKCLLTVRPQHTMF